MKNIELLISQGESETLELKTSTAQLHRAFETICGFLNNKGGTVLIGITDKGKIIGQEISDSTKQSIANEISKIAPPAKLDIDYIQVDKNRYIILLQTNERLQAPYTYEGRAFAREQSVTKKMDQRLYDHLLLQSARLGYVWEMSPAQNYYLDLLDKELISGRIRYAVQEGRIPERALNQDIPTILENLQLLHSNILNNAAVVLFGTQFEPNYYQCLLKVARFKGTDKHEFIDSGRLHGNIFNLLDYGMSFVRKHLPIAARIEPGQMERVETPLIPFNAIREALINALCHRDYNSLSGDIGLAIYDDRMEITNHGGLAPGITIEKIKAGFSNPRNKILAQACYKFCLIENWGRGIQEIIKSCMNARDPEPEFLSDAVEFKVIFKFPRNIGPEIFYLPNFAAKLTQRQKEIIDIIAKEEYITAHDINSRLLKPVSERTIRYELSVIRNLGLISSSGSTKKTTYMLTKDK